MFMRCTCLRNGLKRDEGMHIEGRNFIFDLYASDATDRPLLHYLPGLVKRKTEPRSIRLLSHCRKKGYSYLVADYSAIGDSTGHFATATVSLWTSDECQLSQKKAILGGHGIGAWIAFLIALQRPELVAGIVGISADPDFTEELLWKHLPEATKETIMTTGESIIQWGEQMYPITRSLIEDGRKNLLLLGPAGEQQHCVDLL